MKQHLKKMRIFNLPIEKHLYVPSRNSSDDNENISERLLRCFIYFFSYFASSRYLIKLTILRVERTSPTEN